VDALKSLPSHLQAPASAALAVAEAHRVTCDRLGVLQDGNTLVLQLSATLVARIVTDTSGPRQGGAWFARETAIAGHLATHGAPVIPQHPELPVGPHLQDGYTLNFWQFVTQVAQTPVKEEIGATLRQCHEVLQSFPEALPPLAILTESRTLLDTLDRRKLFPTETLRLLERHLDASIADLAPLPAQPLHGDAHLGNLLQTTTGLLWTDWEDTFAGPVEWDVASMLWNAQFLENDHLAVQAMLRGYSSTGDHIDKSALECCYTARAAVMTTWYPILYPELSPERRGKLEQRLQWLKKR
jgi:hypothetical protein